MGAHFRTGTDNRRDQDNNWRTAEERLSLLELLAVASVLRMSADTDISTTSPTTLNGSSQTITPARASTLLVLVSLDVQCIAFSTTGSALVTKLVVNGVAQSAQGVRIGAIVNERASLAQLWTIAAAANTAYALSLTGELTATGNTYRIFGGHSGYTVLTIPIPT